MTARPRDGYFFEDFSVGDVFSHPLGRTLTQTDNTWFTLLTMNTNELHFNADYSAATAHGREIVSSGLTLAIVLGLSVSDISQNAFVNLGWDEVRLTAPVFAGDTLYAESVITNLRPSTSHPDAGIVSCFTRGLNQDGTEVMSYRRAAMVYRRGAVKNTKPRTANAVDIRVRSGMSDTK